MLVGWISNVKGLHMLTKSILIVVAMKLLLAMGSVAWYISPILKPFPKPTGQYQVGTKNYHWIDHNRSDIYPPETNAKRELMVQVWYPALASTEGNRAPYLADRLPIFQQKLVALGYPQCIVKCLTRGLVSHAMIDAAPAPTDKPYPVIIFSHGLGGLRDIYTIFTEELASHGYFVVSIDHAYLNAFTKFPDGRVIDSEPLLSNLFSLPYSEIDDFILQAIRVYVSDVHFVISQLDSMNKNAGSPFFNKLDLNNLGMFGHSLGGMAAIELCKTDPQCKTGINIDGWNSKAFSQTSFEKPLLMICAEYHNDDIDDNTLKEIKKTRDEYNAFVKSLSVSQDEFCKRVASHCKRIIFPGIEHSEFSDMILAKWPVRSWCAPDAYETIRNINNHIVSFFDTNLKMK